MAATQAPTSATRSTRSDRSEPRRAIDARKLFQAGRALLDQGRAWEARQALRRATELEPEEPRYLSYYGVSLAMAERKTKEAVKLCEAALAKDFCTPEMYLNLGRVYLLRRDRGRAYEIFQAGLLVDAEHHGLARAVADLGVRRAPPLPFLHRSHPVNRKAGRLLHRLRLR